MNEVLIRASAASGITAPFYFYNDAEIALTAALGKPVGIVAVSGTGSIVFGMTADGRRLRVGGWGHLLGDEGSGYSIGLASPRVVMKSSTDSSGRHC